MFRMSVGDGSVTTELMTLLTCTIDRNSFDNIFCQIAFDDGMINIALEIELIDLAKTSRNGVICS